MEFGSVKQLFEGAIPNFQKKKIRRDCIGRFMVWRASKRVRDLTVAIKNRYVDGDVDPDAPSYEPSFQPPPYAAGTGS